MAAFGIPGGAEIWIILVVALIIFAPTVIAAWLIWLAVARRSKFAPPSAPAGWFPDPSTKHELRFWNGATWSSDVSDGGVQTQDPV